jgi:hypothetical protein
MYSKFFSDYFRVNHARKKQFETGKGPGPEKPENYKTGLST